MKHPMQKIRMANCGSVRFVENEIVTHLLNFGHLDMNELARMDFSDADRRQFAQLIGYSVSGYGDLGYAKGHKSVAQADRIVDNLLAPKAAV